VAITEWDALHSHGGPLRFGARTIAAWATSWSSPTPHAPPSCGTSP